MFTRRGEARSARAVSEPQITESQLQDARMAAAAARSASLEEPAHLMAVASMPPPVPSPMSFDEMAPPALADNHSVIGEDLTIEGQAITIRCKGALEIKGRIQAELHSQQLVVGKSGRVEGTIAANSVDIWGRVSGTIKGARVTLHSSAEVEGDIHAKSLSVADGASFEGRSRKVSDAESIAPHLEATPPAIGSVTPIPVPVPMSSQMATTAS